jgi:phenylacetate-CoA ligase
MGGAVELGLVTTMGSPLERCYPYLPVWAQNLGLSFYGLAYRQERLGGAFPEYVAGFRERDHWSAERMGEYTQRELRRVLVHAFREVPYYQSHWSKAGIAQADLEQMTVADLARLPVTPKQDLRSAPEEFVARDVAARHKLRRYQTSGSTGTPVTTICTAADHRRFIAAREVRSFGWAGSSVRRSRSTLGGRLVVPTGTAGPPFHRYNRAERQVYFSAFHIAPANVPDYVAAFNRYRPQLLTGYAYAHYLLARMMIEQGVTLDYEPDVAVLSSEKLTPEMKRVIQQAFRTRAYEEYGMVENCVLVTECEQGRLHANADFGILEIVDGNGLPVPAEVRGRVLGTSLLAEAQPLIRYEIGDVAVWSADGCSCGRDQLPVIEEIVGRLEDVVVGPDGRELVRFHWVFVDLPHVLEGQIVQEALNRITVKLVTTDGYTQAEEQLIRRRFAERLGPLHLNIETVPSLPRTERGKFRAVISRLPVGSHS